MNNKRARGVTKDGKPIFSEEKEQIEVAAWLDANKIFYIHVPNEVPRMKGNRIAQIVWLKKQKRKGVKKGVSDFLIFDPPPCARSSQDEGYVGTALELKALDGSKPSDEQMEFGDRLVQKGWLFGWHRGAEEAIRWLVELGYGCDLSR